MHSVLIVGCGSIGERHLRCFQRTSRAAVSGCDPSGSLRETIAQRYGVPTYSEYETALAANPDVVVICTPPQIHIPMAITALNSGKHVLIEKPLGTKLEEVPPLLEAHTRSQREAAVAYVQHVFPFLVEAREFLLSGELGPIRQVSLVSGHHFPTGRPAHTAHYAKTYYASRETGGGAIQDAVTHMANFVESVVGPTDSLFCDCAHLVLPEVSVEDTVHISARHGEVLVNYSLNQFQPCNESTLRFNTPTGAVKIEYHRERWAHRRVSDSEWTWHECAVPDRDAHFTAQAEAFLDQIEGKPSRLCSLEAAAQTLRFNLAAITSAETDRRVYCHQPTTETVV